MKLQYEGDLRQQKQTQPLFQRGHVVHKRELIYAIENSVQDAYGASHDTREDLAELANIGMAHILARTVDNDRGVAKSAITIHDPLLLRLASRPELVGAILLVTVTTALLLATPTFATEENLLWVCYSFSVIGIATLGMLLVFAPADIDFAIGSEIGLAAIIAGRIVFFHPGTTGWLVFAAAVGSGLGFGLVNGLIVAKLKFNPFIAMLATSFIGRGVVMVLSENRNLSGFSPDLLFLGEGKTFGLPNLLIIFAALAVFWHVFLGRTVFGRQLYAIGGNPNAAYLSGAPGSCSLAGSGWRSSRLASATRWIRSPAP